MSPTRPFSDQTSTLMSGGWPEAFFNGFYHVPHLDLFRLYKHALTEIEEAKLLHAPTTIRRGSKCDFQDAPKDFCRLTDSERNVGLIGSTCLYHRGCDASVSSPYTEAGHSGDEPPPVDKSEQMPQAYSRSTSDSGT